MVYSLRDKLGALIYDVPRTIWALRPAFFSSSRYPWLAIRNRNECLIHDGNGESFRCDWQWTSDLYLPNIFPAFGRILYRRAFTDFPISMRNESERRSGDKPQASFVIGHRGLERLPLLLATLKSIAGQVECQIECIVVEQDNEPLIRDDLPDWVRYVHTPLPQKNMAYSRAWAFNVGAKAARADFLIFHDNDMLVPDVYAKDLLKYNTQSFDFINLKRFIFYLDHVSSEELINAGNLGEKPEIGAIVQNLEAGGSFGANRKSYFDIGGFDERFIGWGGEDNEFWERAKTRNVYRYGYLPVIHLWHEPQPEKVVHNDCDGVNRYHTLQAITPEDRIAALIERNGF